MAQSTVTSGVAERYATALLDLALEQNAVDAVAADVDALGAAIDASDDLQAMLESPLYKREEQSRAIAALADAMGLGPLVRNTALVMAGKRRLFVLRGALTRFRQLLAAHRGEVTADVISAKALTKAQHAALTRTLKKALGREVALDTAVDESLIGGLVVRVGSRMIDTSIRSQLARLQQSMKEAG
ncbi:MAG: F0F1 ATP synthase subunit delta [Pseudomonadota bacterium]